jgi:hypothetical protein
LWLSLPLFTCLLKSINDAPAVADEKDTFCAVVIPAVVMNVLCSQTMGPVTMAREQIPPMNFAGLQCNSAMILTLNKECNIMEGDASQRASETT